jgi:hypothetical protein
MFRGLHFRLHNNRNRTVQDALNAYQTGWADTDGPAGYDLYDSFLGQLWMASNAFNHEEDV